MSNDYRARRSSLALLVLAGLGTCSGLDTLAVEERASATVSAASPLETLISTVGFPELASLDLTDNQTLQNQGVSRSQIDSVILVRLALAVISPSGQDLSFLDEMRFFVSAPELPRQEIAARTSFEAGQSFVEFELREVELADYVAAESMSIDTEATGRRPAQETQLEITLDFLVDVDVAGAICGG